MGNKVRRKNRQESLLQEDNNKNTRIKTEMVPQMILATSIVLKEMDMAKMFCTFSVTWKEDTILYVKMSTVLG